MPSSLILILRSAQGARLEGRKAVSSAFVSILGEPPGQARPRREGGILCLGV